MLASLNLLKIKAEDVEERRKGALLQALVVVLIGLSVVRAIFEIFQPTQVSMATAVGQGITSVLFGLFCLWIIHTGRIRLAAHLFFAVLNLIFLSCWSPPPATCFSPTSC